MEVMSRSAGKTFRTLARCLGLAVFLVAAAAAAEPASDAEIERLLETSRVRNALEEMVPKLEAMQQQMEQQMIGDRELNARERESLAAAEVVTRRLINESLSWEQMRPLYIQLYRDTFDREDILGLIEFYETPLGQRLLEKQPVLMQNMLSAIQQKMMPMLQQLETELQQTLRTLPEKGKGQSK